MGPWSDIYSSTSLVMLSLAGGKDVDMGSTMVGSRGQAPRRTGSVSAAPAGLRPVLAEMLVADPAKRLRSMDAVLAALDASGGAPAPPIRSGRPPSGGPNRILLFGGIGAAVVIALVVIVALTTRPKTPEAPVVPPVARAAAHAEGVRDAVEAALPDIACSWLDLGRRQCRGAGQRCG